MKCRLLLFGSIYAKDEQNRPDSNHCNKDLIKYN